MTYLHDFCRSTTTYLGYPANLQAMKYLLTFCFAFAGLSTAAYAASHDESVLKELPTSRSVTTSTVPANGDANPYGVAFVPVGFPSGGPLAPGDVLVSNFNSANGQQGTGRTIVRIRNGSESLFFQSTVPTGLTTALGVLRSGFVLVGNLPTNPDGTINGPGSLLVIDRYGSKVSELKSKALLDGPWDLTVLDGGSWADVFVSNVLSGTVARFTFAFDGDHFTIIDARQIASDYAHRPDPSALVVGPTGLAYDQQTGILIVASTADNEIFAVANAAFRQNDGGRGAVLIDDMKHLHGPLGLVLTPAHHLIFSNGDAVNPDPNHLNELEEYDSNGNFLASFQLDNTGTPGGAFGIALAGGDDSLRFAAVDDNSNTVTVWQVN
jgi:hypothetical protein